MANIRLLHLGRMGRFFGLLGDSALKFAVLLLGIPVGGLFLVGTSQVIGMPIPITLGYVLPFLIGFLLTGMVVIAQATWWFFFGTAYERRRR